MKKKTLVYQKALRDASITEIQEALLLHVRAKYHTLVWNSNKKVRDFQASLHCQASKCNFEGQLEVALRERLVTEMSRPELQRKLLSEKGTSFQNLCVVCETTEDLRNLTLLASSPVTPIIYQTQLTPEQPTCFTKDTKPHGLRFVWRSSSLTGACLLLNNGRIKNSYQIADNRRKILAFNICRIHIPYILHIGMLMHWPLRSGIDIWWIKLKSPNYVRYRLSVGLWGMEVISASKRSV